MAFLGSSHLPSMRHAAASGIIVAVISFVGESGVQWSYDPHARIGDRSGFGQVFRGLGPAGEATAVKRVPLRWDRESERRRREREVEIDQVLATVSAKHVVRMRDIGRIEDDLLLVMPLADRSLSAAIEAGDLDQVAGAQALRQVAQGLVELAEVPVLHRDLKPANVLDFGGLWRLADLGLARNLLESTATFTLGGFGTLPYMAPELWAGQPATVKTDLYAFGVLAYEVLSGTRPFTGTDEATLGRQHRQEAPSPLPPDVSAAIGRLVLRLLAKEPAERPQDARAVVELLDAAINRLGPQQEALRQAAFEAQQRRSQDDAGRAALVARQKTEGQQTQQALADLHHVLEEAADQAREALPDVDFRKEGLYWYLILDRSRVAIEVWTQAPASDAPAGDPLILAGIVHTASTGQPPSANIVCELRGGRLVWSLLRFEASAIVRRYEFGPHDRPHGFDWPIFARERAHMLNPGMHVWRMQQDLLTADVVVDLLREAISAS